MEKRARDLCGGCEASGEEQFAVLFAGINADIMTTEQIRDELKKGLDDIENGRVHAAREIFGR